MIEPKQNRTADRISPSLVGLLIFGQAVAALGFPLSKSGLTQLDPFVFAFFRFCIATGALLLVVTFGKLWKPVSRRDWGRILLLGFLMVPCNQLGYLVGQSMTAASHGSILYATTPIWVLLLSITLAAERLVVRRTIGIVIAVAGVLTIMLRSGLQVGSSQVIGDFIILASVLAWAAYIVLGKPISERYGAFQTTALAMTAGALLYSPIGIWRTSQADVSAVGWEGWLGVWYMGIGMSVVAYSIFYFALRFMEASRLALFSNIQPIIATATSWLLIGENPGLPFYVGGGVVLLGLVVAEW